MEIIKLSDMEQLMDKRPKLGDVIKVNCMGDMREGIVTSMSVKDGGPIASFGPQGRPDIWWTRLEDIVEVNGQATDRRQAHTD